MLDFGAEDTILAVDTLDHSAVVDTLVVAV